MNSAEFDDGEQERNFESTFSTCVWITHGQKYSRDFLIQSEAVRFVANNQAISITAELDTSNLFLYTQHTGRPKVQTFRKHPPLLVRYS